MINGNSVLSFKHFCKSKIIPKLKIYLKKEIDIFSKKKKMMLMCSVTTMWLL